MNREIIIFMFLQIAIFQASPRWAQSTAVEQNVIYVDDVMTGKVEVHGKFGVRLGIPMKGRFRVSGSNLHDGKEVAVVANLGDESRKFTYEVDPLYGTVKIVDCLQLDLDEREEYWFYEGMHSPGKPINFPSGDGIQAKAGYFGHKLTLRIVLPGLKAVILPVANPSTPKLIVAAEDIVSGKCIMLGRLASPLGKLLTGSILVQTNETSGELELRVTTTNGKSATFKQTEFELRTPGFGPLEDLTVLRKRDYWPVLVFYENASWSGVPKSLEGFGQSHNEFACRSELVVCIP